MIISIDKAQKYYDKLRQGLQAATPTGQITFKIDPAYSAETILEKAFKKAVETNKANNIYFILQEDNLNLKSEIFKANIANGLHDKINRLALLKNKRSHVKNLIRRDTELYSTITTDFINKKIQLIKDAPNMSVENFTVLVRDVEDIEIELKSIDREIVSLEDEIKELNYSTKINVEFKPETIESLDL